MALRGDRERGGCHRWEHSRDTSWKTHRKPWGDPLTPATPFIHSANRPSAGCAPHSLTHPAPSTGPCVRSTSCPPWSEPPHPTGHLTGTQSHCLSFFYTTLFVSLLVYFLSLYSTCHGARGLMRGSVAASLCLEHCLVCSGMIFVAFLHLISQYILTSVMCWTQG